MSRFGRVAHAQKYLKFRPTYPKELKEAVIQYLGPNCRYKKAVDVACGSGKSTRPLADVFDRVIGVDISSAELHQTDVDTDPDAEGGDHKETKRSFPGEFHQGPPEDLSFIRANSVDLITCAQGYHWLDRPRFLKEAKRVLIPGGVLAVYGYGNLTLNHAKSDSIIDKVSGNLYKVIL